MKEKLGTYVCGVEMCVFPLALMQMDYWYIVPLKIYQLDLGSFFLKFS
jgi:hypothetical protein